MSMHADRLRFAVFATVLLVLVVAGCIGFMLVEGLNAVDALYFTIVTMSTVGYGDIHPISQAGKLLAVVMILAGGGAFIGVGASAAEMILTRHERKSRMDKLNMVIGVFFSEVGSELLARLETMDPDREGLERDIAVDGSWSVRDFRKARGRVEGLGRGLKPSCDDLAVLNDLLTAKRDFMLQLLENPNLLEHESFTEMLRAVFHLAEELTLRGDFTCLPESDCAHLAGDVRRVYPLLAARWLDYMLHLKTSYPYLFSLALRTSPFARDRSVVVLD
ncbi:potassium channel family protein [Oceanidesulfovibrio marinus]|uniref:Two pore domain potassium channel family protein n=1 Tax=Oceanidesulfovibrio marinus TaxID=370038 RepID=A0A6P1ZHG1_9BACT|nr:potassium channel family protein [Oceanidesulfovibrio marinus]TVM34042.1 two pore domain potassium channel family protein [Oceanidesulfovibrio marinus]